MTDTTSRTDSSTTSIEAAAFRRLLQHLNQERADVQNIDLMILAGFCRNCLGDWYREAAEAQGRAMTKEQAREAVYGRSRYRTPAGRYRTLPAARPVRQATWSTPGRRTG